MPEDICKLEEWQKVTIQALAAQRERVAQQAQKTINGINAAIDRYAREWADGREGPLGFKVRPDGMYLVQIANDDSKKE